jgi:hypothetical protein
MIDFLRVRGYSQISADLGFSPAFRAIPAHLAFRFYDLDLSARGEFFACQRRSCYIRATETNASSNGMALGELGRQGSWRQLIEPNR